MRRLLALLATLVVAGALCLVGAPAHADEEATSIPLLPNRSLCVRPDFTVTGSGWPVQGAVRRWAEAPGMPVTVTTNLAPDCLVATVTRYRDASGYACGATSMSGEVAPDGRLVATSIQIALNDYCTEVHGMDDGLSSRAYLRSVVMHEVGHALGLPHLTSTRSIMYDYHGALKHIYPVDVRALQARYP